MIVTKSILQQYFLKWRSQYFGFSLPIPKFVLTKKFKNVARFECMVNTYNKSTSDETIYFSTEYDYTEKQLDELMCHEMIHYKLCYDGTDPKCSHGMHFMNMAKDINRKFSLNIGEFVHGLNKKENYSKFHYFLSFLE